ncbi:MAG: YaeQ family protein [Bdellovibrionota bacterium]
MAQTATLYRFRLEVSDIDRGFYEPIDLRTAMHPSETFPYLLSRVFAYALNSQPGLEFSPGGLSDPDVPSLQISNNGSVELWIEIGNPSAKKLHRASKASRAVKVYTYKDPDLLVKEIKAGDVHKAESIELYSFAPEFLNRITTMIERDNKWSLIHNDGMLTVTTPSKSEEGEVRRINL